MSALWLSGAPPRIVYHLNSIALGGMELHALAQRWPGLTVLITGHGTLRQALETEAAALGVTSYTRFLGFVPDTAEIMSLMDVVVIPGTTRLN
jgi:glycosyltransferase involved in cell wall biosynthesis